MMYTMADQIIKILVEVVGGITILMGSNTMGLDQEIIGIHMGVDLHIMIVALLDVATRGKLI